MLSLHESFEIIPARCTWVAVRGHVGFSKKPNGPGKVFFFEKRPTGTSHLTRPKSVVFKKSTDLGPHRTPAKGKAKLPVGPGLVFSWKKPTDLVSEMLKDTTFPA